MRRKDARESFMQMLFEMEMQKDYSRDKMDQFLNEHVDEAKTPDYFEMLFKAIDEHLAEIDEKLQKASSNWTLDRFNKVDLAILRLAAAELFYCEQIPDAVSINEAVELAKKYGTDDSARFINGVLGKVYRNDSGL
ncbi:MAG: transcription antitermination factor NusB [Clostridiales bacterium]|nr:transcription antitermination factor NusB [Clostridiales bacterium]MBQ3107805.1 transcription antitermination factor NusB [Bacillota bacterium]